MKLRHEVLKSVEDFFYIVHKYKTHFKSPIRILDFIKS